MRWMKLPMRAIDWNDDRFSFELNSVREEGSKADRASPTSNWFEPVLAYPSRHQAQWILLDGYWRAFLSYQAGSLEEIPSLCLDPEEASPYECLQLSFSRHLATKPLTLPEKAAFVDRLLHTGGCPQATVISDWLHRLELPALESTVDKLVRIHNWPKGLLQEIHSSDIPAAILLGWAEMEPSDVQAIAHLFHACSWTHSRQKEVMRMIQDLSKINSRPLRSICEELESYVKQLPERLSAPQIAEMARRFLLQNRFPYLQKAAERYLECKKALRLPPTMQLQEPSGFEGETYRLQIHFSSRLELQGSVEKLQEILSHPALEELFSLV